MLGIVEDRGNQFFAPDIKEIIRKHTPNIIFLSETRLNTNTVHAGWYGFDHIWSIPIANGFSGGLLLVWKDCLSLNIYAFKKDNLGEIINKQ